MFFRKKQNESFMGKDRLGIYPERMQVSAIPERRYLKTTHILAIVTFLSLGLLLAQAGIFIYQASRLDIVLENDRFVNLYMIDTERKVIQASEHKKISVSALQLVMESTLSDYISKRHAVLWDKDMQAQIWGENGPINLYSSQNTYKQFVNEASLAGNSVHNKKAIRDVHLYSLRQTPSGLWTGLFDTFIMPAPDMFNHVCNCSENSRECLSCKLKNNLGHERYKVFIRADFSKPKTTENPLGINVLGYKTLYQAINPKETIWDTPAILRPEL